MSFGWFGNLFSFFFNLVKKPSYSLVKNGDDTPNTLVGTSCNDTLNGFGAGDTLVGKRGKDVLNGGDGNDILNGGQGADTLNGGNGSDTATYVDSCAAVTVNLTTGESRGGDAEGDKFSSIENLTGSHYADKLTGDAGNNIIGGGAGNDRLSGEAGDDRLVGGTGNDTIYGGEGNDSLIGDTGTNEDIANGGNDTMYGGAGNDTYSVYQTGDVVVEYANEGVDIVLASVDYTLGANVENLTLFNGAVVGTGNELANIIRGNDGDNIINGKGGIDSLRGELGADTFVFDAPDASSADIVRDFTSGEDKIGLSVSGFGLSFAAGDALPADYLFLDGAKPANAEPGQTAHGQFILVTNNVESRGLYWDADGAATANAPVLFATFYGPALPTLSDFVLVA